jgi:hypothetical protein
MPDFNRTPWPGNRAWTPRWAAEPTQELNARPWLTLGQEYRGNGGRL